MNRKQFLVNKLITKLLNFGIKGTLDTPLRAPEDFWKKYPDGHCDDQVYPSWEGKLSCLSEKSLETILSSSSIKRDVPLDNLWCDWERAGYFETEPEILSREVWNPILYMGPGCYLHLFGNMGFQVSRDILCHGSNSLSFMNLPATRMAITLSSFSSEYDSSKVKESVTDWNYRWRRFRRAMYMSYAIQACADIPAFQMVLQKYPKTFDKFLNIADKEALKLETDTSLGYEEMNRVNEYSMMYPLDGPIVLEMPLIYNTEETHPQVYALLQFSETSVTLTWQEEGLCKRLTIPFPKWDRNTWLNDLHFQDTTYNFPVFLSKRSYLRICWVNLAITLTSLAHINSSFSHMHPWKDKKFDSFPVAFWSDKQCAEGIGDISRLCQETAKRYPGNKDLIERFTINKN